MHNADHWVSGLGTFGLVLRNRATGHAKVLGSRKGELPNATYHPDSDYNGPDELQYIVNDGVASRALEASGAAGTAGGGGSG